MATIVGVSIANPSINNFDDFVYQLNEPFDGAEQEEIVQPEPERNPIPEGTYVDKNTYVYSVEDAEFLLNYTLSTPYVPEGTDLEKIKISNDKRKATLYYSNGLEISHHPMGRNFNNTHYIENPEIEPGKVFYDFGGTFAEGYVSTEPVYSGIKIFRDDRISVRATMETDLDELLKMIEPMDLNVAHVPYTPDPWYVMGAPEPEPIPEPEPEPEIFSHGSTKFVNPNHESLKYYKTIQVIDDTYLGKNVQQWQDAWDWELEANYEIYKDEFYEELGRLLVKNEITQVMNQVGIINARDDFKVHQGYSLTSLPPHVGFTTVINATDGNSYLIEASAHSNRVNYYAITQLTFFDTTEELSLADILSYPQTIHVLPEDGHKSRAEPSNLIIHVDDNAVNFVNRTPETMRIQESGTGEIAREHELTWIGPVILPFGNGQVNFEKPGIYEWDARKAPTLENPLWWDSHAGGEIVVLADNIDDLPLEDRLDMGRTILYNSEIPTSGMGIGNAEHALKVSLRSAIYEMLPDAVQYYQDRAEQLIPFDISIIIEG